MKNSVALEFIWNNRNGSHVCDNRSYIWFYYCDRNCNQGSMVCDRISNKLFAAKGEKQE